MWEREGPFFFNKIEFSLAKPNQPSFVCANFGKNINWPSCSQEEVENVNSLQTEGHTDGNRTKGDLENSLELSAEVS